MPCISIRVLPQPRQSNEVSGRHKADIDTTDLQAGGTWKFSVYILDEEAEIDDYDIQVKDNPF